MTPTDAFVVSGHKRDVNDATSHRNN
jgi:hypothetical protein